MQRLPGFRDFYPEECAFRNYLFENWRRVARSFGFQEYDGPTLESTELYKRKSGEELKTQLFRFADQGDRDVCLRPRDDPDFSPSGCRPLPGISQADQMVQHFSLFSDLRNHRKAGSGSSTKLTVTSSGTTRPAADAELIGLAVALHRVFGLTDDDFFVRVNNRNLWAEFLIKHQQPIERLSEFLAIIDKLERENPETSLRENSNLFNSSSARFRNSIETPADSVPGFGDLFRELQWRGLDKFVELDLTIVRGLDYYTGLVFEIFDRKKENRALAGGGRYDNLISVISEGKRTFRRLDLPSGM